MSTSIASESDWEFHPNVEVKIEVDTLENQEDNLRENFQKYFNQNPLNALQKNSVTIEGTNNSFHTELREIILKCEPDCSVCRKLITHLSTHILDIHKFGQLSVKTYENETTPLGTTVLPISVVQVQPAVPTESAELDNFVPMDGVWVMPENIGNTEEEDPLNTDYLIGEGDLTYDCDQDNLGNIDAVPIILKTYHSCETCGQSFTRTDALKKHVIDVHMSESPYECDSVKNLSTHTRNRHLGEELSDMPKTNVSNVNGLPSQEQIISYWCGRCHKRFPTWSAAQFHEKTQHSSTVTMKQKAHVCEYCDVSFSKLSSLNEHKLLVHSDEKPLPPGTFKQHKCKTCGISFVFLSELAEHIRVHTEREKPYKCESCGICYHRFASLIIHMRAHRGKGSYGCGLCGRCFTMSDRLSHHVQKTHKKSNVLETDKSYIIPFSQVIDNLSSFETHDDKIT